jgi:hypothetical protein
MHLPSVFEELQSDLAAGLAAADDKDATVG